jgi:predicted metalloprotease with PDZ domain
MIRQAFVEAGWLLAASPDLPERATLGIETSTPTAEFAATLQLPNRIRVLGRVIESAEGPAALAGLQRGDVLLALSDVDLHSQDDLDDFLRSSRPGETITLRVLRPGEPGERMLTARLGGVAMTAESGIRWQYASLASLPRAQAEAREKRRKVLVGLSGAET